jgi:uncharacterized RDD family membrane protein YckC
MEGAVYCPSCGKHRDLPPAGSPAIGIERVGAMVIDNLLGLFVFGGLVLLFGGEESDTAYALLGLAYLFWIFFGAATLMKFWDGRTIGKRLLTIRVVQSDGQSIGFWRSVLRETVLKGVFAATVVLLIVDAVIATRNPEGISLHDRIASTRVVTTY